MEREEEEEQKKTLDKLMYFACLSVNCTIYHLKRFPIFISTLSHPAIYHLYLRAV